MAQRAIIILQRSVVNDLPTYGYVLRADVPVARRPFVANPLYVSPYKAIAPDVDPDAANLINGAIAERVGSVAVTQSQTIADIQALLIRLLTTFQADVAADKTFLRFGSYYDGNVWVGQGA